MLASHKSNRRHLRPVSAGAPSPIEELVLRLRRELEQLSTRQEDLAQSRERVLVDRQKLVQGWKRVREQRDQTANAEVRLMTLLRQHYNRIDSPFPTELNLAFSAVDEGRNRLGSLEEDITEVEENLGAQEWEFMELENDLYQYDLSQLLPEETEDGIGIYTPKVDGSLVVSEDPLPPSTILQYQIEEAEHQRLLDCFKDARNVIATLFDANTLSIDEADLVDIDTSVAVLSFDDILTRLAKCEVRLQHLKGRYMSLPNAIPTGPRCFTEPSPDIDSLSAISGAVSRAHSEGDVSHRPEQVPAVQQIRDWLLDCLKQNSMDRMQYFSILQQTLEYIDALELDMSGWETLAFERWSVDMAEVNQTVQEAALVPCSTKLTTNERDSIIFGNHGFREQSEDDIAWSRPSSLHRFGDEDKILLDDLTSTWPNDFENRSRPGTSLDAESQVGSTSLPSVYQASISLDPLSHCVSAPEAILPEPHDYKSGSVPAKIEFVSGYLYPSRCDSAQGSAAKEPLGLVLTGQQTWNDSELLQCDIGHTADHPFLADLSPIRTQDITYSPWQWSFELQRYFYLGFGTNDDLIEAIWSEPVPAGQGPDVELAKQANRRWRFHSDQRWLDRDSKPILQISNTTSIRCPWIQFCQNYIGHFNPKYAPIATPEQDLFYRAGRVLYSNSPMYVMNLRVS
ncbi:hypothetical protein C7974DRAFT_383001 [Boeremia exigua]|uniref:uncharacterized protein n=1 Tax=Boeremia exigua TaxID=749465 RepID=UPI001E8E1A4F|nr:uncharacterized protein C7974DRAFT_383001 [Boeremia exigua]KAH6644152.1 hypothetical protein C7974DRAFT_383001 [Boeremia exigua]